MRNRRWRLREKGKLRRTQLKNRTNEELGEGVLRLVVDRVDETVLQPVTGKEVRLRKRSLKKLKRTGLRLVQD